jgi:DNA mismatch repair ATPase MutS
MKLKEVNPDAQIVCNDLSFDAEGSIYILTGPNSGGKSIFACGVGILQIMFQLGMPIPASGGSLSPVDGIFTHFPAEVEVTTTDGRLGSECALVKKIFDKLTPHSIVLLDETFSGTGSFEGSFLAADVLAALSACGVRAIYCTHMHELTTHIPDINSRPEAVSKVSTLSAGAEGSERFRIFRRAPDGKSYTARISEKYGLSYEKLIESVHAFKS